MSWNLKKKEKKSLFVEALYLSLIRNIQRIYTFIIGCLYDTLKKTTKTDMKVKRS